MKKIILTFLASSFISAQALAEDLTAKAEDIVIFRPAAFACDTEANFEKAYSHWLGNEKTKFIGMFGISCEMLRDGDKYKVLSTKGVFARHVEIININSSETDGFWTSESFIKKVISQ